MLETFSSGPCSSSSSKTKMPFVRRRRPHLTSTRTDQIEVQGTTYLCFPLDHSWFQGNINTDDESSYSLYGERVLPDPEPSCHNENGEQSSSIPKGEENNNLSKGDYDNNEGPKGEQNTGDLNSTNNTNNKNLQQGHYKVVLTDHFTGLSYHLPRIGVNLMVNGTGEETNLFSCTESDADVKFQVQNIYKGQKADMVIQRCLGSSSSLLGQKSLVYSGPISIVFNEVIENGRSWSL